MSEVDSKDVAIRQIKTNFEHFLVSDVEKYEVFKEKVELFFVVNPVPKGIKSAVFLNGINDDVYKLIKDRVHPCKPINKSVEELFKVLDSHFKVVVNVRSERFKFNSVRQEAGEKLSEFVVRLREAASKCEFGNFIQLKDVDHMNKLQRLAYEEAMLDRFVMGLSNQRIQEKLLFENPQSFEAAFDQAKTMQMALDEKQPSNTEVNLVQHKSRNRYQRGNSTQQREPSYQYSSEEGSGRHRYQRAKSPIHRGGSPSSINSSDDESRRRRSSNRGEFCNRCGYQSHYYGRCPAVDKSCTTCRRRGHFSRCCNMNQVDVIIGNIISSSEVFYITISIDNLRVSAQVDTGACANIMSPQLAKHFKEMSVDKNANALRNFSGGQLNVVSRVVVPVVCAGARREVEFVVVDTGKPFAPLLGRPGLDVLCPGWRGAFGLPQINEIKQEFAGKLTCLFPEVLSGDMNKAIIGFKAEIILSPDHVPIFAKPYSIPLKFEDQVKEELRRLVDEGVLEPCGSSRYASPIVVVPKADKLSIRICIDCKRTINKYVENNNFYPLPDIDTIFAALHEAHWFSILDLKQAYQQLELTDSSKEMLTINTPAGLFRYNRLPFGVSAAPSIFQMVIDQIIEGVPMTRAYLDDIIIGGKTEEECQRNVLTVMEKLNAHRVKVNGDKCVYLQTRVKYLGHVLGDGKLTVNPEKVKAIQEAPAPRDIKELQAYMGLINYYRKFVPEISMKLSPLYQLLKKGARFTWTEDCDRAFRESRSLVTNDSCLQLYNPKADTYILCDASPIGVAAVLVQKNIKGEEVPVYYASKILNETQKNYAQLHREGLAVMFGLRKFYKYVYGRPITIVTDAQSIKEMFSPDKATPAVASARIQRWSVYLSQFDYRVEHRSSRFMTVPDALSRLPCKDEEMEDPDDEDSFKINLVFEELPVTFQEIIREGNNDVDWKAALTACRSGFPDKCQGELVQLKKLRTSLSLEDGAIFYNDRILIPLKLRKRLLYFCHQGHQGMVLMKKMARKYIYWPGMDQDIENWINSCGSCQQVSAKSKRPVKSHWEEPREPFERIHIDFFHMAGKTALIIVDSFTRLIDIVCMKSTTGSAVIKAVQQYFDLWGLPRTLVSDNGPPFNSWEFIRFCESRGIKCLKSPAYHPESNGLAEVGVRVAKSTLKKFIIDKKQQSWEENVRAFLVHHRHTPRSAGERTPMEMLLGYRPRLLLDLVKNEKRVAFKTPVAEYCSLSKREVKPDYVKFMANDRAYYKNHFKEYSTWLPCRIIKQVSRFIFRIKLMDSIRDVHISTLRNRDKEINISSKPIVSEMETRPNRKRCRSEETYDRELPRRSERLKKFRKRDV